MKGEQKVVKQAVAYEDDIWVGLERAKDVRNAAIEECANVAEDNAHFDHDAFAMSYKIATAIRALKDKP